jgi:hypothetical protein
MVLRTSSFGMRLHDDLGEADGQEKRLVAAGTGHLHRLRARGLVKLNFDDGVAGIEGFAGREGDAHRARRSRRRLQETRHRRLDAEKRPIEVRLHHVEHSIAVEVRDVVRLFTRTCCVTAMSNAPSRLKSPTMGEATSPLVLSRCNCGPENVPSPFPE